MEDKKSLNFFERIYYSIFKFDKYDKFLEEKKSIATRYILVLTLLVTLLICFIEVFTFIKVYDRGRNYVLQNKLPEFIYKDGKLHFSEKVENYDEQVKYYFLADTNNLNDEQRREILDKTIDYRYSLVLFEDRVVYSVNGVSSQYEFSKYSEALDLDELNNQELIKLMNSLSPIKIFGMIFGIECIYIYIAQIIATFMNILLLFLSGILICRVINLSLDKSAIYNISCYSITLSVVVTLLYNIFYFITNRDINNIDTVYLILAYIYLIASLFIIKQEVSKQKIEIKKTIKNVNIEKGKTVEELEKEKEAAKEDAKKKKEGKKEKEEDKESDLSSKKVPNNGEPDGSEI